MIGDIILNIKTFVKQNLFCIHKYKYVGKLDFRYEICLKCDKIK